MARHVGIYEMRAKLGELVKAAGAGESFVVDVRGKPVARLVPYHNDSALEAAEWLKGIATRAKRWGVSARGLVVEGRR